MMGELLGILNNIFKPTLVQKFARIKVYNELALAILLYGSEIWALKKKDKTFVYKWDEIFQNSLFHTFWPQKEWRNFLRVESRTSWWEAKEMQIKLATKMDLEVLEETVWGGWNGSIKAKLVSDDDDIYKIWLQWMMKIWWFMLMICI